MADPEPRKELVVSTTISTPWVDVEERADWRALGVAAYRMHFTFNSADWFHATEVRLLNGREQMGAWSLSASPP